MTPPTPERFRSRSAAATVAAIDIFLVFLNAIIFGLLVAFVAMATFDQSARSTAEDRAGLPKKPEKPGLQASLSNRPRLQENLEGTEPGQALKGARFWKIATVIFAAQSVIFSALSFRIFGALITIIVRGLMLHRVIAFIDELEKAVKEEEEQDVENVGVRTENQLMEVNVGEKSSSDMEEYTKLQS